MQALLALQGKMGWWLVAFVLYTMLATSMIALTSNGRDIATLWPANAVLLALLLSRRNIGYLGVCSAGFAANILANALTRGSIGGPFLFGFSNMVEVALAAALISGRADKDQPLTSPSSIGRFVLGAGLAAPAVSALFGAATAVALFDQPPLASFERWFLSDALGLLIFTPALWSMFNGDFVECFKRKDWKAKSESALLQLLVLAVAGYVFFFSTMPLLFIIFAPVMLITFRVGRLGAEAAIMMVAATGAVATIYGFGPIVWYTGNAAHQSHLFQGFLAVLSMTCLPAVADLSARQAQVSVLSKSAQDEADRATQMARLAATDSLTGVLNRRAFEERAKARLAEATSVPACLVAIDLDHFKQVNDNFGHAAGDAALVHLSALLQSSVRSRDIVGRLGGDEFMILLDAMDMADAQAIAARLKSLVAATPLNLSAELTLFLSMSYGVAQHRPGLNLHDLKAEADANLYCAKAMRAEKMPRTA